MLVSDELKIFTLNVHLKKMITLLWWLFPSVIFTNHPFIKLKKQDMSTGFYKLCN